MNNVFWIVIGLYLAFCILDMLLYIKTPFRYKESFKHCLYPGSGIVLFATWKLHKN